MRVSSLKLSLKSCSAIALFIMAGGSYAAEPTPLELKRANDIAQGQCFLCHGMDGENSTPLFPRLAAQNAAYVTKQLNDFKTGARKGTMNAMVTELTSPEMKALGVFFNRKPAYVHEVANTERATRGRTLYVAGNTISGVLACASCHGDTGAGTDRLPRLAGQHAAYLTLQLKNFNTRARTNDNALMHNVAAKMTQDEILDVAEYLSGLK